MTMFQGTRAWRAAESFWKDTLCCGDRVASGAKRNNAEAPDAKAPPPLRPTPEPEGEPFEAQANPEAHGNHDVQEHSDVHGHRDVNVYSDLGETLHTPGRDTLHTPGRDTLHTPGRDGERLAQAIETVVQSRRGSVMESARGAAPYEAPSAAQIATQFAGISVAAPGRQPSQDPPLSTRRGSLGSRRPSDADHINEVPYLNDDPDKKKKAEWPGHSRRHAKKETKADDEVQDDGNDADEEKRRKNQLQEWRLQRKQKPKADRPPRLSRGGSGISTSLQAHSHQESEQPPQMSSDTGAGVGMFATESINHSEDHDVSGSRVESSPSGPRTSRTIPDALDDGVEGIGGMDQTSPMNGDVTSPMGPNGTVDDHFDGGGLETKWAHALDKMDEWKSSGMLKRQNSKEPSRANKDRMMADFKKRVQDIADKHDLDQEFRAPAATMPTDPGDLVVQGLLQKSKICQKVGKHSVLDLDKEDDEEDHRSSRKLFDNLRYLESADPVEPSKFHVGPHA